MEQTEKIAKGMTLKNLKSVLESAGKPMNATEIHEKSLQMGFEVKSMEDVLTKAQINSVLSSDIRRKGINSEFIKTSTEPNTYTINNPKNDSSTPKRESVPFLTDAPTGKKVKNLIEKIQLEKLNISNERELELVMWGAICGRWPEWIKFRPNFGGRSCDVGLGGIAVEMKYVKSLSDKDRLVGQVLDYMKDVDEVVVIAVDDKGFLKNSTVSDIDGVTIVIF